MNHIQGINRLQLTFSSLDELIDTENSIRIIDAFIDKPDLDLLGFISRPSKLDKDQKLKKHFSKPTNQHTIPHSKPFTLRLYAAAHSSHLIRRISEPW